MEPRVNSGWAIRCSAEHPSVSNLARAGTDRPSFAFHACRSRDLPAIIPMMPEPAAFPVQVLLFARYAELLGASAVTIHLRPGGTVADVVDGVRALPGGAALPERVLVARGVEQVGYDQLVGAADELAFLPPMSGG